MIRFFLQMFDTDGFPPRWNCGTAWADAPYIGWVHIVSDLATFLSYTTIPILIGYFLRKRKDVPFPKVFLLFCAFIFACGTVHLVEAIMFWWPIYRFSAISKLLTASVSISTVVSLIPTIPIALKLRTPREFEEKLNSSTEELRTAHQRLQEKTEAIAKTQQALRESEERFRAVFEQAAVGIALVAEDGSWIRTNSELCKIVGYSMDELSRLTFQDITHPDDLGEDLKNVEAMLAGQLSSYSMEKRYYRKDNQIVWVRLSVSLVDPDQESKTFIAIVADITEEKKAKIEAAELNKGLEKRVQERTSELLQANKELEAFSYSVSHDLRAPIRHILGFSNLLESKFGAEIPEKGQHYINTIRCSADHASALIDALLMLSRTSRATLNVDLVNLNHLVNELKAELLINENTETEWQISELPEIKADYDLIRAVMQNLLENALKFSSKRERIEIRVDARQTESEHVISVSDNGAGFKMDYADKLFTPFQRLHDKTEFDGTGIGLAIVRRIVLRHGGRVFAVGEEAQGATFSFAIPTTPTVTP